MGAAFGVRKIRITADAVSAVAVLNDGPTADAVWEALPLSAAANRWGKEIYFPISVRTGDPEKQAVVQKGDLGYWEPGGAFCVFWGPTPASKAQEIRPASPVNVFGRIEGDASVFDSVASGTRVVVEKVKNP